MANPEELGEKEQKAQSCARLAALAVFTLFVVGVTGTGDGIESGIFLIFLIFGVSVWILFKSLQAGIEALKLGRKTGFRGILFECVLGITVSALLLSVILFAYFTIMVDALSKLARWY